MRLKTLKKIHAAGLVLAFALAASTPASAAGELSDQRHLVELGIYAGAIILSDSHELYDYPNSPFQRFKDSAFEVGGRLAYLPLPWIGIEAEGGVMPTKTDITSDRATLFTFRGHLLLQLPLRITPFLLGGAGLLGVASANTTVGDDIDLVAHWGGGIKWYVNDFAALRIDGRHIIADAIGNDETSHHFEVLGGVSFVLGWERPPADTDSDGVPDDKDRCPEQAADTADGCPPPPPADSDGDGVPDESDKCPSTAANTSDGCPPPPPADSDGDGVPDASDKCPDAAANTADGCPPDGDGDGVPDGSDKCPNTVGTAESEGCPPDGDSDGIVDSDDRCPAQPETKNGFEDDDGCPDELPKIVKRFTGSIKGITFALGRTTIRPSSFRTLNRAAKVLQDFPGLRLMIRGHSDSSGSRNRNMELSAARAAAVKTYLVSQEIAETRIITEGVGPDEPIAANNTKAGRAENRRIEFKIVTD